MIRLELTNDEVVALSQMIDVAQPALVLHGKLEMAAKASLQSDDNLAERERTLVQPETETSQ